MTTTKQQVIDALADGDTLAELDCYYNPGEPWRSYHETAEPPLIHCRGDELPTREYSSGFGGVEGEPLVCFSERYVYFRHGYDGAESIERVPRHPEFVISGVVVRA